MFITMLAGYAWECWVLYITLYCMGCQVESWRLSLLILHHWADIKDDHQLGRGPRTNRCSSIISGSTLPVCPLCSRVVQFWHRSASIFKILSVLAPVTGICPLCSRILLSGHGLGHACHKKRHCLFIGLIYIDVYWCTIDRDKQEKGKIYQWFRCTLLPSYYPKRIF